MQLCQGLEHSSQGLGMSLQHQSFCHSQHTLLPALSIPTITSHNHYPEVSADEGCVDVTGREIFP